MLQDHARKKICLMLDNLISPSIAHRLLSAQSLSSSPANDARPKIPALNLAGKQFPTRHMCALLLLTGM